MAITAGEGKIESAELTPEAPAPKVAVEAKKTEMEAIKAPLTLDKLAAAIVYVAAHQMAPPDFQDFKNLHPGLF